MKLARFLLIVCAGFPVAMAAAEDYREPYRPQFHFSPRKNWTNDPNGLVYFNGVWHLFFQHNPFGDVWGHMSWGHATSRDLVRWHQRPVALAEENGVMIFTGSTVVDQTNSSGFCSGGPPCLVAIYTGHTMKTADKPALQTQNLAYSNDGGIRWTKYNGNPVLDLHLSEFRDPKVFWSREGRRWIMVVSLPDDHKVRFYGSPDLKRWEQLSEFGPAGAVGGQWECPELFELPLADHPGETRWILKIGLNPGGLQGGSGEQYFIGRFDGVRFVNDNPASRTLWTDYGKDCYCALTFNNVPAGQTMLGWMNNWQYANVTPTSPWRGQMTVPRELSLRDFGDGLQLAQQPAAALAKLRRSKTPIRNPAAVRSQTFELLASLDIGQATELGFRLLSGGGSFTTVGYDVRNRQVFVDRTHSGATGFHKDFPARTAAPLRAEGSVTLHVLVDRSSVEVFAGDGQIAITNLVYPPEGADRIEFFSEGGSPGSSAVSVWELKSIW